MATSAHLALTLVTEGQASGETTVNECIRILEALVFQKGVDRSNSPGTATEGNVMIVGPSGSGLWSGQNNKIAIYMSGAWKFVTPEEGWMLWVRDTIPSNTSKSFMRYDGALWVRHFHEVDPPNSQRIFQSSLPGHATGFVLVSGTAYFTYLGRAMMEVSPRPQFVEFHVSTIGAGAQIAEVGLFSSPSAPNKAAQSLTKIVSTGTVDTLISTGVKRNTAAFGAAVPFGTHLWAGIRTAMATTQPTIESLCRDMAQGNVLSAAAAGVLTAVGPFSGTIIAAATGPIAPDLRVTLD